MKPTPTVSVRISEKRWRTLRKDSQANGHTITWLLNYIIDLYYQEQGKDSLNEGRPLPWKEPTNAKQA